MCRKSLSALTFAIALVYLLFAQRRFYGDRRGLTAAKTLLLWGGRFLESVALLSGSLLAAIMQFG